MVLMYPSPFLLNIWVLYLLLKFQHGMFCIHATLSCPFIYYQEFSWGNFYMDVLNFADGSKEIILSSTTLSEFVKFNFNLKKIKIWLWGGEVRTKGNEIISSDYKAISNNMFNSYFVLKELGEFGTVISNSGITTMFTALLKKVRAIVSLSVHPTKGKNYFWSM